MKHVLLYGTGLDSHITRAYLKTVVLSKPEIKELNILYYDLKHRYSFQETEFCDFGVIIEQSINLGDTETESAFIPNRNLILAMHASGKYNADVVWLGGSLSDRISDNNERILDKLSDIITESLGRIVKVKSPFWNMYKEEMVDWYVKMFTNGKEDLLLRTFSCYKPTDIPHTHKYKNAIIQVDNTYDSYECLKCPACFRKCALMYRIGININFKNDEIIDKYAKEFEHMMDNPRVVNTREYIRWLNRKK